MKAHHDTVRASDGGPSLWEEERSGQGEGGSATWKRDISMFFEMMMVQLAASGAGPPPRCAPQQGRLFFCSFVVEVVDRGGKESGTKLNIDDYQGCGMPVLGAYVIDCGLGNCHQNNQGLRVVVWIPYPARREEKNADISQSS